MAGNITKAMILAAGEGTRLRPLTLAVPKVLLPVAGVPVIERTVRWLRRHGVSEIVVNLHHLGEAIEKHLGDGTRLGVRVRYSWERELRGTAGGVKHAARHFDEPFVVVYGDVLADFDLAALARWHRQQGASATLALHAVPDPTGKGVVEIDERGVVTRFVEKPPPGWAGGHLVNGGVYVLEPSVLAHIPAGAFSDFGHDVFPRALAAGVRIYGYVLPGDAYLVDMGTPEDYQKANREFAHRPPAGDVG